MSEQNDNAAQKQAIARLVSQGKMTHETPGQYVAEGVDQESADAIPQYDLAKVAEAMPDILQIDFDENDEDGCWATLEDGKSGESTKVMLGADPPETTDELIAIIQKHYRDALAIADDEEDPFAAFGDDED